MRKKKHPENGQEIATAVSEADKPERNKEIANQVLSGSSLNSQPLNMDSATNASANSHTTTVELIIAALTIMPRLKPNDCLASTKKCPRFIFSAVTANTLYK